jgi:molybdate transport system substrate-binding protein
VAREDAGVGRSRDRILPGVDVRAALAAVESSGAQAGIVYRTDAARSRKVADRPRGPDRRGPEISYPVAVVAGRPDEKYARAFVEFLGSSSARRPSRRPASCSSRGESGRE